MKCVESGQTQASKGEGQGLDAGSSAVPTTDRLPTQILPHTREKATSTTRLFPKKYFWYMQMLEGKAGKPVRVKGKHCLPSASCLLQAILEVSCQDVHQREEQPDLESFAPQDFLLKEVDFILHVLCGLGEHLPPK